jgi:hypothetical protein
VEVLPAADGYMPRLIIDRLIDVIASIDRYDLDFDQLIQLVTFSYLFIYLFIHRLSQSPSRRLCSVRLNIQRPFLASKNQADPLLNCYSFRSNTVTTV